MGKIIEYREQDGQLVQVIGETIPVDLAALVEEFNGIKQDYLDMPTTKTTPDQETLDVYNTEIRAIRSELKGPLVIRSQALLNILKPVREAGLLPAQYEDGYLQLETFVNNNA